MQSADPPTDPLVIEIGVRLRDARQRRDLSLAEVEARSAGRWRASTLGAYERGIRKPSVSVLLDLATFYAVPVQSLLGVGASDASANGNKSFVDLQAPATAHLDRHILRVLRQITQQRGGPVPRFLAVRQGDLELLAATLGTDLASFLQDLRGRGVLVDQAATLSPTG